MALRHAEEPERRLSPEEARAFLQVHAEREAGHARDDAPTAADLAETLRLSPEETESILREARARAFAPKTPPRQSLRPRFLAATAAALLLVLGASLIAANQTTDHGMLTSPVIVRRIRSVPSASPPVTLPAEFAPSPGSVDVGMVEAPPAGFQVEIDTPNGLLASEANPRAEGAPSHLDDPAWSAVQREGLARTAAELLANGTDERGLAGLPSVSVYVRVQGGGRTRLMVPVPTFTPPLRNDPQARAEFRAALSKVLQAGWPEITHPR